MLARLNSLDLVEVNRCLARAGWELRTLDVDLVAGRLAARLFRADGRWLHVSGDVLGRWALERWHRSATVERCFGVGPQFDSCEDQFLGRVRGAQQDVLHWMSSYIAENPAPGYRAIPVDAVPAIIEAARWAAAPASAPAP